MEILKIEQIEWEVIECCNCHVMFAINKKHKRDLLQSHESFYCPNGHGQHFIAKTNAEKWKEYAESVDERLKHCHSDREELFDEISELQNKNKDLIHSRGYYKGMITKLKNMERED